MDTTQERLAHVKERMRSTWMAGDFGQIARYIETCAADKWHKAHDVPNLYIVDGSNLVTGGRNHPTMTIEALAFRASEHLIKTAKEGAHKTKA